MSDDRHHEVYAVKYAERDDRTRSDSFILADDHTSVHPMDYFVWVIRNAQRTILVDTGYDNAEGTARDRPVLIEPRAALADIGISPAAIDSVIVTHLHYDHAGGLSHFPDARLHIQDAEMAYATGRCMCHDALQMPYTADHVCEAVKRVYSGKVTFHDGDAEIAPGITVHRVGGHSRGLQCVRVETATGPLVLASDASHYYENFETGKPFPIVVDLEEMLAGFDYLNGLAAAGERVIPGHDPLVRERFPQAFKGARADVRRLDL
ncbi:MAG: N-acyl homoserine lactonase family protein [Rhizobiales bacterium]|nr:N-acyl homoserine lactonase family protein [Hyphomicrobiales bacterium]